MDRLIKISTCKLGFEEKRIVQRDLDQFPATGKNNSVAIIIGDQPETALPSHILESDTHWLMIAEVKGKIKLIRKNRVYLFNFERALKLLKKKRPK